MTMPRRIFLTSLACSGAALCVSANAQPVVNEKDANAVALGYVADAKKTDTKKFPKYAAGQTCANCALFQEKTKGCPLFAGKQVAAAGWCNAWAKKA